MSWFSMPADVLERSGALWCSPFPTHSSLRRIVLKVVFLYIFFPLSHVFIPILNVCFFSSLFFSFSVASSLCNHRVAQAPTPSLPVEEPVAAGTRRRAASFLHRARPPLLPSLFVHCVSEVVCPCAASVCYGRVSDRIKATKKDGGNAGAAAVATN